MAMISLDMLAGIRKPGEEARGMLWRKEESDRLWDRVFPANGYDDVEETLNKKQMKEYDYEQKDLLSDKSDDIIYLNHAKNHLRRKKTQQATFLGLPSHIVDPEKELSRLDIGQQFIGWNINLPVELKLFTVLPITLFNLLRMAWKLALNVLKLFTELLLYYFMIGMETLTKVTWGHIGTVLKWMSKTSFLLNIFTSWVTIPLLAILFAATLAFAALSAVCFLALFIGRATTAPINSLRATWKDWGRIKLTNYNWLNMAIRCFMTALNLLFTATVYGAIAVFVAPFVIAALPTILAAAPAWLASTVQTISLSAITVTQFVGGLFSAIGLAPTLGLSVFTLTAALVTAVGIVGSIVKSLLRIPSRIYEPLVLRAPTVSQENDALAEAIEAVIAQPVDDAKLTQTKTLEQIKAVTEAEKQVSEWVGRAKGSAVCENVIFEYDGLREAILNLVSIRTTLVQVYYGYAQADMKNPATVVAEMAAYHKSLIDKGLRVEALINEEWCETRLNLAKSCLNYAEKNVLSNYQSLVRNSNKRKEAAAKEDKRAQLTLIRDDIVDLRVLVANAVSRSVGLPNIVGLKTASLLDTNFTNVIDQAIELLTSRANLIEEELARAESLAAAAASPPIAAPTTPPARQAPRPAAAGLFSGRGGSAVLATQPPVGKQAPTLGKRSSKGE